MSKIMYSYFFTPATSQYLSFFLQIVVGASGFKHPKIYHSSQNPTILLHSSLSLFNVLIKYLSNLIFLIDFDVLGVLIIYSPSFCSFEIVLYISKYPSLKSFHVRAKHSPYLRPV